MESLHALFEADIGNQYKIQKTCSCNVILLLSSKTALLKYILFFFNKQQ